MKRAAKFVIVGLLVCILAAGVMFGTMFSGTNLNPGHTFVQYNGSNAIELSKDGVRTGADTWQVTLGITNSLDDEVSTKPVEVAMVIDASLSMTYYNASGTSKTRLKVVQKAAVDMIEDLYNKAASLGITIKVSLSSFNTSSQVRQTMLTLDSSANKTTLINAINNLSSDRNKAYTNLQGGILRGISTFYNNFGYTYNSSNRTITISSGAAFNDPNSVKLMVVLTDGYANRYYSKSMFDSNNISGSGSEGDPNSQDAAIKAATAVKDKDITVFSIGFNHTDSTLEGIASYKPGSTTQKLYYTAQDDVDLSAVFETITNDIDSPALEDEMGNYLTTSMGTVSGPSGITIGTSGESLSWTPGSGALVKNHGNFITYTITLDYMQLAAGTYDNYALNDGATFNVVINEKTCTGDFPQPTGKFDIGTLNIHFKTGSTTIAPSEPQQKLITDWGTPKFTINTPPASIVYEGVTYYYSGSTYDTNAYTVPGSHQQTATVGTHTLIHNYCVRNHDVTYAYDTTAPGAVMPANAPDLSSYGGTYAAGTENIAVEGTIGISGYTFHGWTTNDVTVSGGNTFTMPDKNVSFKGYYTANTDTAYTVNYYKQKSDGGGYELQTAETENKTGTTGATGIFNTEKPYTGYSFFKAESNLTPKTDYTIQGDGSLIIDVYYNLKIHNVTYTYTGGVPTGVSNPPAEGLTIGYSYGANVTILTPTYPATHTFSGWTPTGIGVSSGSFTMPDNDVSFIGSFTASTAAYKVEHYTQDLTGGGFNKVDTDSGSGNIGTSASYDPNSYTGFTYAQSLTTSTNTVGSDFIIKADGTLVIKLYYLRDSYQVSYAYTNSPVPDGATALPLTLGYSFGATVTVAENASAPGYSFGGWSTSDAQVSGGGFTMPANDVLLKGTFTPCSNTAYQVEHYKQILGGTYNATPDETENKTGTTDTAATYAAKSYTGFTNDSSATTSNNTVGNDFIIKADGSLVIKLYYTRNANYTYRVEYRKDSTTGTLLDSKSVANRMWGQTYDETAITITGYTAQAPLSQNVTIDADNKVLIFIYKANKHNVTYELEGTIPAGFDTSVLTALGAADVEFGTPMTRAAGLTAANYNFTGWVTGDVPVDGAGNYNMPDKDVKFVGSFTLMPAWVVYEYTGDVPTTATALPATGYYNLNNPVTIAPAPAAVTGYTFEGWTRNGSAAVNFTITAAGEYKIIGNWVRNSYNVTYQYDSSAPATAPAVPAQTSHHYTDNVFVDTTIGNITGYTFNGWVPTAGLTSGELTDGSFSMPTNDVVFTGSWSVKKHNVTYQLTGTIPAGFDTSVLATLGASDVAYNTPMTVAGPLSYTIYKFHGWTSSQVTPVNGNYQMPDSDVVFTGYFTKNVYTVRYTYIGVVPFGAPALPAGGSYEVGTEVTVASPVSLYGYAFYGWESEVSVTAHKFTMPSHDVVFVGWWVSLTSSIPWEPSYYSQPSSVPSSAPSSTPSSSRPASSRPTVSVSENQTPLDVINMGGEGGFLVAIIVAVFAAIMLAIVFIVRKKRLRYYR